MLGEETIDHRVPSHRSINGSEVLSEYPLKPTLQQSEVDRHVTPDKRLSPAASASGEEMIDHDAPFQCSTTPRRLRNCFEIVPRFHPVF